MLQEDQLLVFPKKREYAVELLKEFFPADSEAQTRRQILAEFAKLEKEAGDYVYVFLVPYQGIYMTSGVALTQDEMSGMFMEARVYSEPEKEFQRQDAPVALSPGHFVAFVARNTDDEWDTLLHDVAMGIGIVYCATERAAEVLELMLSKDLTEIEKEAIIAEAKDSEWISLRLIGDSIRLKQAVKPTMPMLNIYPSSYVISKEFEVR